MAASNKSRGQTLVEFTLLLPLILILVGGLTDVGLAFYVSTSMENAVREGARLKAGGMSTPSVKSEVASRVAAPGMFTPAFSSSDVTVGANTSMGASCANQERVTVTATGTYNYMFLNLVGMSSTQMSRSATMRVEGGTLCN